MIIIIIIVNILSSLSSSSHCIASLKSKTFRYNKSSFLFALLYRSKSRSVDHGLAAPYDLDSLRSKVEGRFDSVERLSRGKCDSLTLAQHNL